MDTSSSPWTQLATECQAEGLTPQNSEKIGAELARVFQVKLDEVGILRLAKDSLVFVHPAKLHQVGSIPLNSSTSAAVRTFNSRRPEINNSFAKTKHTSFFEMVETAKNAESKSSKGSKIIQKLMSVPVIAAGKSTGVLQICRKGATVEQAGPDFTPADLQTLVNAASTLGKCFR
ncbi:MAG TPA: GAF domain-containing protein [Alphaproteobacteria bacterium]|nr:GAF domain-containing protein [Alphaproteobacteria bacterium]